MTTHPKSKRPRGRARLPSALRAACEKVFRDPDVPPDLRIAAIRIRNHLTKEVVLPDASPSQIDRAVVELVAAANRALAKKFPHLRR